MEDQKKTFDRKSIFDDDFENKLEEMLNGNRVDNLTNILQLTDYSPNEDNEMDQKENLYDDDNDISFTKYKSNIFKKRMIDVDCNEPCIDKWIQEYNDLIKGLPPNQTKDASKFDLGYLKELHTINYLTFSLFANQFFDQNIINACYQDNSENEFEFGYSSNNKNKNTISEEDNEKIKEIIKYDPNNIEPNEDLFLNIAQGFISFEEAKKDYEKILSSKIELYNQLLPEVEEKIEQLSDEEKKNKFLNDLNNIKSIEDMYMLKLTKLKELETSLKA